MDNAFNYHPLSKITVREKLLFGLSVSQSLWLLAGIFIAGKMADLVPPLPFKIPYGYLHYLIPVGICAFFAFVTHKSGLTFIQYWLSYLSYRLRKNVKVNRSLKGSESR